jgi:hypothetical protein
MAELSIRTLSRPQIGLAIARRLADEGMALAHTAES